MKEDVIKALSGEFPGRIPSKETLNHPGLIEHVTGIDPFADTARAYEAAWEKLGIDIHPPLGRENAARAKVPGGTWEEDGMQLSDMGVYPTSMPAEYCPGIEKSGLDWVFEYEVPESVFLSEKEAAAKSDWFLQSSFRATGGLPAEGVLGSRESFMRICAEFERRFGKKAVNYQLYYTTLFMWPVTTFGWEAFMMAASMEPDRFDRELWQPWAKLSREYFEAAAESALDVVFCHDDLTMKTGPVFAPDFYEKYIFPKYEEIFAPVVEAGKKIVYVCDGNLDVFLERLLDFPIDGLMFESPATDFERVCETWGAAGRGVIGGLNTEVLTNGTADQVREHTAEVIEIGRKHPGFMISSPGGIHGNIPLENAIAYFQTRNEMGIPAEL